MIEMAQPQPEAEPAGAAVLRFASGDTRYNCGNIERYMHACMYRYGRYAMMCMWPLIVIYHELRDLFQVQRIVSTPTSNSAIFCPLTALNRETQKDGKRNFVKCGKVGYNLHGSIQYSPKIRA